MRELERKHSKRRKYGTEASLYDVPNEILLELIFPNLSDRDIHNLGVAFGKRIEKVANDHLPLGKMIYY